MAHSLALCGMLATLILLAGRHVQRRRKRARIYGRRAPLPIPAIWQDQFALSIGDRERGEDWWRQLSQTFGVEPGRLRLSDRFDGELRHLDHLLDGWLLLTIVAAETCDERVRPEQIQTVGDFMRLALNRRPIAAAWRRA